MSLTLSDIAFLQTSAAHDLLAELAQTDLSSKNLLSLVSRLRESHPQEHIHAALTTAQLRRKAAEKFGNDANKLFFTDDALQQASDPLIRAYRTRDYSGLRILDVCCGIGTDSIAFARAGAIVHGIDTDETRIAIAKHNAGVLDLDIHFEIVDATQLSPQGYDLIFFDPARRDSQGKRLFDVEQYIPPLSLIKQWDAPRIMVKISPGVDLEQLSTYDADIEFISVNGDLKEAVLHLPGQSTLIATRIDEQAVTSWRNRGNEPDVPLAEPGGWLCEPDPAILRASLVQHLAESLNGTMLDKTIAYFCTPEKLQSDWLRAWKIREWLPFNLKKLRSRLRAMNVGTLTVKKRGSAITPEELIRKLKLKGDKSATVILTRYDEHMIAIICDDIAPA